jgi:hypothetical protein
MVISYEYTNSVAFQFRLSLYDWTACILLLNTTRRGRGTGPGLMHIPQGRWHAKEILYADRNTLFGDDEMETVDGMYGGRSPKTTVCNTGFFPRDATRYLQTEGKGSTGGAVTEQALIRRR